MIKCIASNQLLQGWLPDWTFSLVFLVHTPCYMYTMMVKWLESTNLSNWFARIMLFFIFIPYLASLTWWPDFFLVISALARAKHRYYSKGEPTRFGVCTRMWIMHRKWFSLGYVVSEEVSTSNKLELWSSVLQVSKGIEKKESPFLSSNIKSSDLDECIL